MNIQTDEWTTCAEAARLLGVSNQRVQALADEGLLHVTRPWPRVALIGRRSIAERLAGERATRILPADARRYVLAQTGAANVQQLDLDTIRDHLRDLIGEARFRWAPERCDKWALETADRLFSSGSTMTPRKELA